MAAFGDHEMTQGALGAHVLIMLSDRSLRRDAIAGGCGRRPMEPLFSVWLVGA